MIRSRSGQDKRGRSPLSVVASLLSLWLLLGAAAPAAWAQQKQRRAPAERVPEGTVVKVRLQEALSSKEARVGDRVRVTLSPEDRSGLPEDTIFVGRVTQVRPASASAPGLIDLRFGALERNARWQPVSGSLYGLDERDVREDASGRLVGKRRPQQDRNKLIGYGAAGGAVVGYLLKNKTQSALTGALLGAAAGYLYSEQQKKKGNPDVELEAGSEFGIYLNRAVALRGALAAR